jgi:hypothetical protein
MADVDRIAPPVPTLPPPVGRGVDATRRQAPRRDRTRQPQRNEEQSRNDRSREHINEYV